MDAAHFRDTTSSFASTGYPAYGDGDDVDADNAQYHRSGSREHAGQRRPQSSASMASLASHASSSFSAASAASASAATKPRHSLVGARSIAALRPRAHTRRLLPRDGRDVLLRKAFAFYARAQSQYGTTASFEAIASESERVNQGEAIAFLKDFGVYPQLVSSRDAIVALFKAQTVESAAAAKNDDVKGNGLSFSDFKRWVIRLALFICDPSALSLAASSSSSSSSPLSLDPSSPVDPLAAARTLAADRLAAIAQSAIGCGVSSSANVDATEDVDEADMHDAAKLYALLAHMRLLGRTVAAAVGVGAAVTKEEADDGHSAAAATEGGALPSSTQAYMITAVRNRMRPFNMRPASASAAVPPSHLDRDDNDWSATHAHAASEDVMATPHRGAEHSEYYSPTSSSSSPAAHDHQHQRTPHSPFGSPQSAHQSRQQRQPRASPNQPRSSPPRALSPGPASSVTLSPFPFAANARPASGVKGFDEADWDALHSTDKQATAHERQVWF